MGATKLIEEAEMLCAVASAAKSGAVSLAGVLYEQDRDFIVGARTLVPELAAALKASEESLQDARAELAPRIACIGRMEEERRALQSANLAANKRIVELEHERDEARNQLAPYLEWSCKTCGCTFGNKLTRADKILPAEECTTCFENHILVAQRDAARAELARLTTPRPIAEAPRDGTWILGCWPDSNEWPPIVMRWTAKEWQREDPAERDEGYMPTHYLPLPEVKP